MSSMRLLSKELVLKVLLSPEAESKEKHGVWGGADYNLTLCPLQSRLQYIYHGH